MVFSLALSILTFAGMQVFKDQLSTEGRMTILGGFIGSWFFVFFTTVSCGVLYLECSLLGICSICCQMMGNFGTLMLGETYNIKLFPEGILSILMLDYRLLDCVVWVFLFSYYMPGGFYGSVCFSAQSLCNNLVSSWCTLHVYAACMHHM